MPLNNLMEGAATAEISRAQIWQWIRHPKGCRYDGTPVAAELFRDVVEEELADIRKQYGEPVFESRKFGQAKSRLEKMMTSESVPTFLTLEVYGML